MNRNSKRSNFIFFKRNSAKYYFLIKKRPTAFVLLSLIAQRAKRTNDHPDPDLQLGEALIGDYGEYKSTLSKYRTDKKYLEKYKFITIKTTSLGTIAKIIDSSIFDINQETSTNKIVALEQAINKEIATNNNDKSIKNENIKSRLEEKKEIEPINESVGYKKFQECKKNLVKKLSYA